jgi:hypothetical protein
LVAVGIVAAVLVVFALQVLGTARKLASEVKLMREAQQITQTDVQQPQQTAAQTQVKTHQPQTPVKPQDQKEAE